MSLKRVVLPLIILISMFVAAVNYTVSANYNNGNQNSAGKSGKAPVKTSAKRAKSKKSRFQDEDKKSKKRRKSQDQERKVIRIDRNASKTSVGPISKKAESFAVSPELKTIPEVMYGMPPFAGEIEIEEEEENNKPKLERIIPEAWTKNTKFEDPLASLSRATGEAFAPQTMPAPTLTFDGILANDIGTSFGSLSMPPDTVGDVGPNHYVQAVNFGVFRVFNKANGAPVTGLARISAVFSGFPAGHPCRAIDDGDPIVNYDPLADRWLLSQFQVTQSPHGQCIAVSQTGDPTGSWFAYYFLDPNGNFPDYPHWGVWTNGYYLATHDFNPAGTDYTGGGFYAFNREKMLAGNPSAEYVFFSRPTSVGHLPADIDGYMPPAPGTPAMFFEYDADEYGGTDSLLSYEFVPNFANPASSTLIAKPAVEVSPFDARQPRDGYNIEQPPPATDANYLDSIGDRLMFRVAYRNLGTTLAPVNSYVMNWTVNVSGLVPNNAGNYQAAPRWTELRRNNAAGEISVFDQGTHAPDSASGTGRNRWMGSIAQDYLGNIALGFSRSGPNAGQNPDIVWAGRTGGQIPAGTMNEGETTMFASTGVQEATNYRWGDYSSMTVDPVDDCTFWYSQEYRNSAFNGTASSNQFKWSTRIGKFKFPTCTSQPKGQIAANVTFCNTGAPVNNARITATAGNFFRLTNSSGNLISNIVAAPGTYSVTADKGNFVGASTTTAVINGNASTVNLCLNGANVGSTNAAIASESCAVNNAADPGEFLTVNLGLQNIEGEHTSNLTATLLPTGGVTLPSAPQNYGALTAGGAAATRSFSFVVDSNVLPSSNITLTLALTDGARNLGNVSYTVPVGGLAGVAQNFSYTGSAFNIPDGNSNGVSTTINVSGVNGPISDLNFIIAGTAASNENPSTAVGVDHSWIGDLRVKLTSPAGTTVTLIDQINDSGVNGDCASNNIFDTVLDDSAPNAVDNACPGANNSGPLTGTFKPQNLLAAFNGENPNGTWTLNVSDLVRSDTGTVRAYRLVITPATAACTGKSVGGTIRYGTDLTKRVSNVTMNASGSSAATANTNSSGIYALPGLIGGGTYTIAPTKSGNRNGISSFDATLVLRCVAAGPNCSLTPDQRIAAETSGNNTLSSFDATLILRFVAAGGPNANTGLTGNWVFSPSLLNYSPLANSLSNEDYKAFLLGEVNGNWTTGGSFAEEAEETLEKSIKINN